MGRENKAILITFVIYSIITFSLVVAVRGTQYDCGVGRDIVYQVQGWWSVASIIVFIVYYYEKRKSIISKLAKNRAFGFEEVQNHMPFRERKVITNRNAMIKINMYIWGALVVGFSLVGVIALIVYYTEDTDDSLLEKMGKMELPELIRMAEEEKIDNEKINAHNTETSALIALILEEKMDLDIGGLGKMKLPELKEKAGDEGVDEEVIDRTIFRLGRLAEENKKIEAILALIISNANKSFSEETKRQRVCPPLPLEETETVKSLAQWIRQAGATAATGVKCSSIDIRPEPEEEWTFEGAKGKCEDAGCTWERNRKLLANYYSNGCYFVGEKTQLSDTSINHNVIDEINPDLNDSYNDCCISKGEGDCPYEMEEEKEVCCKDKAGYILPKYIPHYFSIEERDDRYQVVGGYDAWRCVDP